MTEMLFSGMNQVLYKTPRCDSTASFDMRRALGLLLLSAAFAAPVNDEDKICGASKHLFSHIHRDFVHYEGDKLGHVLPRLVFRELVEVILETLAHRGSDCFRIGIPFQHFGCFGGAFEKLDRAAYGHFSNQVYLLGCIVRGFCFSAGVVIAPAVPVGVVGFDSVVVW
ncbi:hypothetical protein PMAYCL1PPCAC_09559 [Pristionchus mayeri]|uniref:Uncharacterized protein n=1 Tax=Pristionchus mayeri TaxID=1317129 RepID=A0AAN5CE24_9BILA|nr:hypothetical protein PMAYCL1PPCAC_09559 [Pristionchus mayeri]